MNGVTLTPSLVKLVAQFMVTVVLIFTGGGICKSAAAPQNGQPPTESGGVSRLTRATYQEALKCGRSGADCAITPYLVCPSMNEPFSAYIATPFSRVASKVYEASTSGEKIPLMDAGEANAWGFGVYVIPGSHPLKADSIEKAVIMRRNEVIQPITATIAPSGSFRGNSPLSKAFFAFPMGAFAPTSSMTLVLTGASGVMHCSFDEAKLKALR